MSNQQDDYANNIDDQLLNVAKQEGVLQEIDRVKLEQANHQVPQLQHHHNGQDHYQELDLEYNIQIPEPIVDAKSKIYPVTENTITAEGNLITRPYPEQIFPNRDLLNHFIGNFARDNGFGVVIAHSNKKAIYYTCELGGRYRHKKKQVDESTHVDVGNGYLLDPSTKTKKLRCPYAMTASFKKSTGVWTLRTVCNEHNHPQLDPLANHPMLRKRSDELNTIILGLYKVGTKPSHIEAKIREDYPDVLIKREDIYNEIRGYKRKLKKQSRWNSARKNESYDNDMHYLHQQSQQEEFQRQYAEVTAQQQLEEQQYQQFQQYQQEHMNDDSTAAAAAAIAAVAANEGGLNMDNIDSRLVGE